MSLEIVQTRIVWIEDGDNWRHLYTPIFQRGFRRPGVSFEARADFSTLNRELDGNELPLADAYILDNEIAGESEYGAEMALRIHHRAAEIRRDVLVVTMLSSNPGWVVNHYGADFGVRGIPVFDKLASPMVCGFYVGRCLREGKKINLEDWTSEQGLVMPKDTTINGRLIMAVYELDEGSFYCDIPELLVTQPEAFVSGYGDSLEKMRKEISRVFPRLSNFG